MNVDEHLLIQAAQIDLLQELKRICEKYGISYILVGGSMLGAIRHHGFIPWDDDLDVGMLRKDYKRFTKACEAELKSEYLYVNWDNDNRYPHSFMKLKIRGTTYVEKESQGVGDNEGIFIDVFPYDNVPKSHLKQRFVAMGVLTLHKALQLKLGWNLTENKSVSRKFVYWFAKFLTTFISFGMLKKIEKSLIQFCSQLIDSDEVVSLFGAYGYKKEKMPRSLFTRRINVPFCGMDVAIPEEYDEYLTGIFGEYMKLPPISERTSKHQIIQISLGSYVPKTKF